MRNEIDICGFYDCYTIAVILTIEDMGFCEKGHGGRYIEEHDLSIYAEKLDLGMNYKRKVKK